MTSIAPVVLADSRAFLQDYLSRIERTLNVLHDEDIWWRANEASNSIGNLLLHLAGSTRMWVVGVAAGRSVIRDRDAEFAARGPTPKSELLAQLRDALAEVDAALAQLDTSTLLEHRQARGNEVTVLSAVLHAVEHFSMHTGQIIVLAKLRTGTDLRLRG